jgi:hypothetical protein
MDTSSQARSSLTNTSWSPLAAISAPRVYAGLSFVHWQRAFLELPRDRVTQERLALERAAFVTLALVIFAASPFVVMFAETAVGWRIL